MSPPTWETVYCTDYSRVERDTTGVYPEEMEIAQEIHDSADDPDDNVFELYRFGLDRLQLIQIEDEDDRLVRTYLVPGTYNNAWTHAVSQYDEWFHKDLKQVAEYCGTTVAELRKAFCSEDVKDRAWAYESIGSYHGYMNLDSYPLTLTQKELDQRWK